MSRCLSSTCGTYPAQISLELEWPIVTYQCVCVQTCFQILHIVLLSSNWLFQECMIEIYMSLSYTPVVTYIVITLCVGVPGVPSIYLFGYLHVQETFQVVNWAICHRQTGLSFMSAIDLHLKCSNMLMQQWVAFWKRRCLLKSWHWVSFCTVSGIILWYKTKCCFENYAI